MYDTLSAMAIAYPASNTYNPHLMTSGVISSQTLPMHP